MDIGKKKKKEVIVPLLPGVFSHCSSKEWHWMLCLGELRWSLECGGVEAVTVSLLLKQQGKNMYHFCLMWSIPKLIWLRTIVVTWGLFWPLKIKSPLWALHLKKDRWQGNYTLLSYNRINIVIFLSIRTKCIFPVSVKIWIITL